MESNQAPLSGWELGCRLLYFVHWFNLSQEDLAAILSQPDALQQMCTLIGTVQNVFDSDTNQPIEDWARQSNADLNGQSPADYVRSGRLEAIVNLNTRLLRTNKP